VAAAGEVDQVGEDGEGMRLRTRGGRCWRGGGREEEMGTEGASPGRGGADELPCSCFVAGIERLRERLNTSATACERSRGEIRQGDTCDSVCFVVVANC
jgi:hypothetical protein